MRIIHFIIPGCVLLSGCASTIQFFSPDDANQEFRGRSSTLILHSGEEYCAQNIEVGPDPTTFLDHSTNTGRRYGNNQIRSFQDFNHIRGAIDGVVVASLLIAPAGVILLSSKQFGAGLAFAGLAIFTETAGLVVGLFEGHQFTYTLPANSVSAIDSVSLSSTKGTHSSRDNGPR